MAVILIIVGLFMVTQGAYLGQPLVMVGVVIGLILAVCPARANFSGGDQRNAHSADNYRHYQQHFEHR